MLKPEFHAAVNKHGEQSRTRARAHTPGSIQLPPCCFSLVAGRV